MAGYDYFSSYVKVDSGDNSNPISSSNFSPPSRKKSEYEEVQRVNTECREKLPVKDSHKPSNIVSLLILDFHKIFSADR